MEKTTQILVQEREAIRKVVAVMAQVREQLEVRHSVDADLLRDVVQFMRVFCDQCHHGKQDSYLFPLLESKGMPTTGSPMSDLKEAHQKGRQLTNELSLACSKYIADQRTGRLSLMKALHSLVSLYREHMWKEEYLLLPIVEKMLSVEDHKHLADQFRMAESDIGAGAHRAYEALAEDLRLRMARSELSSDRAA